MKKLCNKCGVWTNQAVVHCERVTWEDEIEQGFSISGGDKYSLIRCLGCDSVSLPHEEWFSEDVDPDGELLVKERRYPPAAERRQPVWLLKILPGAPLKLDSFLQQIYVALHNQSYRLCAIGIRALIEDIMIDCVGDQGTLGRNIDAFLAAGYMQPTFLAAGYMQPRSNDDFRSRVIEAGHAAMHRGHEPTRTDVATLLDITEFLIASIYIHPRQVQRMTTPTPRKANRQSTS